MRWPKISTYGVSLCCLAWLGCASTPPLDNPITIIPGATDCENPVIVAPGLPTPEAYADVYDRVLDALDDYFVIKPSQRHSGTIETMPRIAPGYEQPWKPSTPDPHERLMATFQTIRHFAVARIEPGDRGGFRVYVEVYRELENLPAPMMAASNTPVFLDQASVDRSAEIISGPTASEPYWIPSGRAPHRDFAFEQAILKKIRSSGLRK